MPHFHDYGLVQGLLQPLFSGDPCYFMSPLSFLKRPTHWLGAITKYRGTHSQAPNFAYEHCIRRVSPEERAGLNLASWKAAGNAAEPINPEVLEKFIETFEPCGFQRPPPRQLMDLPRRRCSSRRPGSTPDRAFSNWTRTPSLMDGWFLRGAAVRVARLLVAVIGRRDRSRDCQSRESDKMPR